MMPLLDNTYGSSSSEVVPLNLALREGGWPEHLLLICYWGCTIYSVLDLNSGQVGITDLDCWEGQENGEPALEWQVPSLESWLLAWVNGEDLFFEMAEA